MLTFSTYPLVTHHGTPEAKRAGRIYLGILVFTSVFGLLFGVLWTYSLAGTLDFQLGGILGDAPPSVLPWLLALFAFGTGKAALMPFHRWLPNAMVAPTPVSALLHAVAVVKAGPPSPTSGLRKRPIGIERPGAKKCLRPCFGTKFEKCVKQRSCFCKCLLFGR